MFSDYYLAALRVEAVFYCAKLPFYVVDAVLDYAVRLVIADRRLLQLYLDVRCLVY